MTTCNSCREHRTLPSSKRCSWAFVSVARLLLLLLVVMVGRVMMGRMAHLVWTAMAAAAAARAGYDMLIRCMAVLILAAASCLVFGLGLGFAAFNSGAGALPLHGCTHCERTCNILAGVYAPTHQPATCRGVQKQSCQSARVLHSTPGRNRLVTSRHVRKVYELLLVT